MARRLTRRTRRIWISIAATAIGLLAVGGLGVWLELRRSTDLRDASGAVTRELLAEVPGEAPQIRFRDRAAELGLAMRHGPGPRGRTLPEDTGSGLAWGDYDGDGDFDLYAVNFQGPLGTAPTAEAANRLYRNDGVRFVDVGARSGTADLAGFGMGASFADYDGDGDLDLYVTNYGPNRLFRNRGDGSFEDVAPALGVDDGRWSITPAWGDLDRDGRLDLYVTNYVEFDADSVGAFEVEDPNWEGIPFSINPNAFDPQPNALYRQTAAGGFEEIALLVGASNPRGRSLGATVVDLDGDGWLDLYVANDVSPNALLHSRAAETDGELLFEELGPRTGTADPRGSMGLSVTDLAAPGSEPDGLPDLFITHWVAQENALYQALRTDGGRLEYRDRTRARRLGEISTDRVGWGSAFVDFDLDGRIDLAVANGSTLEDGGRPPALEPQRLFLFWNGGDRFHDLAPAAGEATARAHVARGLAAADFDGDGDDDLAISVNRDRLLLLGREGSPAAAWIAVRLPVGALTTGARIEVSSGGLRQVRWWRADASYASAHAEEMVYGLGRGSDPVSVTVELLDGRSRRYDGVPVGRRSVLR